jgi:hypothetical protein
MTRNSVARSPLRRARWSFWGFVGIAMLAAGSLSAALGAGPGPLTGLRVAVSGMVLIGALALAGRVMVALERARRRARRVIGR